MTDVSNPWSDLPLIGDAVLPMDERAVARHNASVPEENRFVLQVPPEPFLGRPDAPVVLLGLNPGFEEADLTNYAAPVRREMMIANLTHGLTDYPFYFLQDAFADTGGWRWWGRKLRRPIETLGRCCVAHNLLVVEWLGYKSRRFRQPKQLLPSQAYGFHLVRRAMNRGAVIVLMRSVRLWHAAVPGLADYENALRVSNPQNPAIGPGNLGSGYDRIVTTLRDHCRGASGG